MLQHIEEKIGIEGERPSTDPRLFGRLDDYSIFHMLVEPGTLNKL